MLRVLYLLVAFAGLPSNLVQAEIVKEIRVGLTHHNICVTTCDNANKEGSPNLNGELVFSSPGIFAALGAPRPYVTGSVNLAGDTSFLATGLSWQIPLGGHWSFEPSLGYAVHSGSLNPPFPNGDPRNGDSDESTLYLGSQDLFRTGLALNRRLSDRAGIQILYEHLSHGQIIGSGRNQGLDTLGMRFYYRFGGAN